MFESGQKPHLMKVSSWRIVLQKSFCRRCRLPGLSSSNVKCTGALSSVAKEGLGVAPARCWARSIRSCVRAACGRDVSALNEIYECLLKDAASAAGWLGCSTHGYNPPDQGNDRIWRKAAVSCR
jgi:hypothetical protein